MRQLLDLCHRFFGNRHGSIAVKFALAGPAVIVLSLGAIDLMAVRSVQAKLQSIADAAALAGAGSLSLAADDVLAQEQAASFVVAEMSRWEGAPEYTGTYEVIDGSSQRVLHVRLEARRPSFFGNLLPPGGWRFAGDSKASPVGQTPLCALSTSANAVKGIEAIESTLIRAPQCMVHSNSEMHTRNSALIEAAMAQTVKGATGTGIIPMAGSGAAPIADPFSGMSFPSLNSCNVPGAHPGQGNPIIFEDTTHVRHYLPPGIHCRPFIIRNKAELVLLPGDHLFRKSVTLQGHGALTGSDVFLFFDHGSDPLFSGVNSVVDLSGRRSGPYAGMVMATIGGNSPDINIPGKNVRKLLGVVYVRNGFLRVTGSGAAASDSDWTVVVARQILLTGTASLIINANYANSDVPVPDGVGPNAGGTSSRGSRLVF